MPVAVVTDYTFPDLALETAALNAAGIELKAGQCKTSELLIPHVREADAVLTQFAPVNRDVIGAMERAKVIIRYGIGVDNVDLEAARARGIPVCNVPDYCIDEVADQTLALILATTRQIVPNALHVRSGNWGLAGTLDQMRTLRDLTVGIVGFGRIGREVAARLAPFKCRRLVFDPMVPAEVIQAAGCVATPLEGLLAEADVVTLHCPSTPQTRKLLNCDTFAVLKPGSIVINVGRGDLIDTPALIEALESGHVSAAALDVFDPEPPPVDSPLRSLPNVITASHVASASVRAVTTLRETVARIAIAAVRGESLPNVVNGVGT